MAVFTRILAGGLLLLFGRKLFWLYVAALGFLVGMTVATDFFNLRQDSLELIVGLAFGVAGALLAFFVQKIAISVAGFLGGAYLLGLAAGPLHLGNGQATWIVYLVGGVLGMLLMSQFFDFAIIIFSSLAGASLILEILNLSQGMAVLAFIGLFGLGYVVQVGQKGSGRDDD